jgi:DNA-binding MarR family transcriptional regulator
MAERIQPTDVANRLRPVLVKLNRELRRELRALGVTGGQMSLLVEIEPPGMSGHVDRLVNAGLVTRTRSETDRRRVGVELTAEGRRVVKTVKTRRTAWLAERLKGLDQRELEAIDEAIEPLAKLLGADA